MKVYRGYPTGGHRDFQIGDRTFRYHAGRVLPAGTKVPLVTQNEFDYYLPVQSSLEEIDKDGMPKGTIIRKTTLGNVIEVRHRENALTGDYDAFRVDCAGNFKRIFNRASDRLNIIKGHIAQLWVKAHTAGDVPDSLIVSTLKKAKQVYRTL